MPRQLGHYPNPAAILSGGVSTGTIITIPAGRTWVGSLTVTGTVSGTAAVSGLPNIKPAGTGVVPTAGVVVAALPLNLPAVTAGFAHSGSVTVENVTVIAPAGNAVTLEFDPASASASRGVAIGCLL